MSTIVKVRPMVDGSALSSDEWVTPKYLCDLLGPFDLDPASNARSHVRAASMCTLDESIVSASANVFLDGLAHPWRGSVFTNFPYSKPLPWCVKLAEHDGPWCALVKLDPTCRWWSTLMSATPQVAPFRKRLKFEGDKAMTANFPSALVYRNWSPSRDLEQHLWLRRWV